MTTITTSGIKKREYKVGNQVAIVEGGWLLNVADFKYQIWTNDEQWSMSEVGTAKEIAKEWRKRFAGTTGELNNKIMLIRDDGRETEYIGPGTCIPRYNGGELAIDVEVVFPDF